MFTSEITRATGGKGVRPKGLGLDEKNHDELD